MANGEIPPVKDRLEMMTATQKDDTGLTCGLLRVLNRQVRSLSCIVLLHHFARFSGALCQNSCVDQADFWQSQCALQI